MLWLGNKVPAIGGNSGEAVMATFSILARLTIRANVLVEADDEEQAVSLFEAGKMIDDGRESGELLDWVKVRKPELI